MSAFPLWFLQCDAHDCDVECDYAEHTPARTRRAARSIGWHTDSSKEGMDYCPKHAHRARTVSRHNQAGSS